MNKQLQLDHISPGIASAVLFIFLDIVLVAVLDAVLARFVCLDYYRRIDNGETVTVKSSDISGVSNFLIGKRRYFSNLLAIFFKVAFLVVILITNLSINGKSSTTNMTYRYGTFIINASDEYVKQNKTTMVRRIYETSKSCRVAEKDTISYYALRFNLSNNLQINDEFSGNEVRQVEVNDSTVICMSPDNVEEAELLIKVKRCTRVHDQNTDYNLQSCLSTMRGNAQKIATNITNISTNDTAIAGEPLEFDEDDIGKTFWEYPNPQLTCLPIQVALRSDDKAELYKHCLLISINYSEEENSTTVERWEIESDAEGNRTHFTIQHPGIVFDGIHNFGKAFQLGYLKNPYPFTDYKTMSGELVSQASAFSYISENSSDKKVLQKVDGVDTTIHSYAVILAVISSIIILVSFAISFFILYFDKRPRFNTINGLSSIIREEYIPSGRSYVAGEQVLLGLKFVTNDEIRFGPIASPNDAVPFQEDLIESD